MTERWLPVVGYEGRYEVSDLGRVKSLKVPGLKAEKMLTPYTRKTGAMTVTLSAHNKSSVVKVAHLVLTAFVGPKPEGLECCHWDDDGSNNTLTNLRWDTNSANKHDLVRNGNHLNGRKTHCPQGHDYAEHARLYQGRRYCKKCYG